MTVVTQHPGAVGSGRWTDFTVANLAVAYTGEAFAYLDSSVIGSEGFVQSASAFGFAIPADATITSLTVEGQYKTSDVGYISLTPSQGQPAWEQDEYGVPDWTVIQGVTDTGTGGLPTVAQLNSSGFAVAAHATRPMGYVSWVYLDYITLTVEYDEYVPPEGPGAPTVTTSAVSGITPTWAQCGGTLTNGGDSPVAWRGVCWGSAGSLGGQDLTFETADGYDSTGGGMGVYACTATPLTPETGYWLRAFAVNASATGYGAAVYFETPRGIPTVTTSPVVGISPYGASCGGTLTAGGWTATVDRGVCWASAGSLSGQTLTLETAEGGASAGGGMGNYACTATPLTQETGYWLRAYAENSYGVAYGAAVYFETPRGIPTVVTSPVIGITPTDAQCGGTLIAGGFSPTGERGVIWGAAGVTLETALGSAFAGGGMGNYACTATPLTPGTGYWLRAYAVNSYGVAYGAEVHFVTHGFPVVATAGVYDIDATTATSGGNIASDGGEAVTARGVCWSIAENPTTAASKTIDGSGLGAFVSALTGLTGGATYNVRAYAVNLAGTAYGAAVVFTATEDAPPAEPPPGPPRDPSRNLLFDGTLELMVGTLDVAGSATQMKYSNSNPGGFGNLSFRLPAAAPYAAFDAQVVKGAAVTMKHGLAGFAATLFEGEVTSDVSHATIAGGKAYYDVTCAGLWWKAGQRKDFSMVTGDDAYDQWFAMDDNAKAFQVSTDGKLEIRLEAGQSAAAGDSASLYYWLGKGMGDPAASIDFLIGLSTEETGGANWHAEVSSALTPWDSWTTVISWGNSSSSGYPICFPITGTTPQALRFKLYTDSAVTDLAADRFIRLEGVSVGSGVSANGLSAVSAANPTVVTSTSAHGLRSGDRVFITQTAASTPTISGWRTVTVTNATHFTVPVAVTTAGGAGTFYKATRIDQALVEIAVTTGLATLASLQPGGIGNLNWGLVVRPHASRAGGIDLLAATNVAPFDYGFWDNKTFYCQDRPLAIRALHDYLIDSSLPGIDFDVRRATEDSPTVVKVLYKFRAEEGETSPYPDGTALAVYRPSAPTWDDAGVVLDVWNEWADLSLTTAQAGDLGDQILAWLSANAYQGGGSIAPATVPLRGEVGSLTIQPDAAAGKDSYLYSSGLTNNYGSGTDIEIGDLSGSVSAAARGVIAFDLSGIPAGAVITSATLSLWEYSAGKSAGAPASWPVGLRRVLMNWVESQATYNAYSTGNNWATVGCGNATDRVAAACASLTLDATAAAGFVSWSGVDLVAVCQGWLDGTFPNYGLLVSAPTAEFLGTTAYAYNAFYSSDYTTAGERPKLTIWYSIDIGTKPVAYIRGGDYIEDSNLDTGPLMITGFSMDADRGVATLGIGENRRAFVERLTPDKA